MPRPDQDEVVDRWLCGETTPEERSALAQVARADPGGLGAQAVVDGLLRASRRPSVADRVMQRLPPGPPPSVRPRIWLIVLGLCVVLALVASAWLLLSRHRTDPAPPAVASARTVSLAPTADTAVDEGHPTASPGDAMDLSVCGAAGDRGIAYLRFPLPPQAIRHGVLVLNSVSGTGTVSVHVVDAKAVGTWSEADLRWWHRLPVGPALGVLQQVDGQWRLQLDGLQGTEVELALLSDSATPIVFFSRESGRRGPCLVFETDDGSAAVRNADF